MLNAEITLSASSANKLLELLNTIPEKKRDVIWNQLYRDITRARSILSSCKMGSHKCTILKCNK